MAKSPPEGMAQVIPYLYYEDATPAVEFMKSVLGFEVEQAFRDENNKILHATVRTGSGVIFVGPGMDEFGTHGTPDSDWVTSMTYVYVGDVDLHYDRVKSAAGVRVRAELQEHFGGNRQYTISDPFGHRWTFAQPIAPETSKRQR